MERRPLPSDADAAREVEGHVEELGDPEAAPSTPSGTLALAATPEAAPGALPGRDSVGEIWRLAWPVMLSMTLASVVGSGVDGDACVEVESAEPKIDAIDSAARAVGRKLAAEVAVKAAQAPSLIFAANWRPPSRCWRNSGSAYVSFVCPPSVYQERPPS